MTSGFLGLLIWLPVFIALWVGVIGLAKAGRGGAWWSMMCGLVLLTVGIVAGIAGAVIGYQTVRVVSGPGGSGGPPPAFQIFQVVMVGAAISAGLGVLLFSIGFALHGFRTRRMRERITELEMVISAQNEQLTRFEGGPTV